ncbi:hypothetical protein [Phenylobacterium sp.]|jgi:hypothetical protein|uniref:hypothetical protein n=1 Tax=Phenylobacterium sp. TaxID=1871053 RepID=UPI002F41B1F7
MKPAGSSAVMAARAPELVEADDSRQALHRKLEYFPTPPWAARAGGELIARLDAGPWQAWEPACGEGHMAHGLADDFARVHASDIHDHGWDGQHGPPLDFLGRDADVFTEADWIVTNPPFGLAAEFVQAGLRRARRGVAVLARTTWFESAERYPLFFGETPLSVFAPFFERVPMALGRWEPKGSTATAYAWFVWMKPSTSRDSTTPIVKPIPPGTRHRLTRPDDARLFGAKAGAPLFDEVSG